eukprot:27530_6
MQSSFRRQSQRADLRDGRILEEAALSWSFAWMVPSKRSRLHLRQNQTKETCGRGQRRYQVCAQEPSCLWAQGVLPLLLLQMTMLWVERKCHPPNHHCQKAVLWVLQLLGLLLVLEPQVKAHHPHHQTGALSGLELG